VVERSPEKAGVGGSTPSLATIVFNRLQAFKLNQDPCVPKTKPVGVRFNAPPLITN
jgi:hypothetical protein